MAITYVTLSFRLRQLIAVLNLEIGTRDRPFAKVEKLHHDQPTESIRQVHPEQQIPEARVVAQRIKARIDTHERQGWVLIRFLQPF